VASDLPEDENAALAESLARPVVEHLRKAEAGAGLEEQVGRTKRIEDRGSRIEDRAFALKAILDPRSSIIDHRH